MLARKCITSNSDANDMTTLEEGLGVPEQLNTLTLKTRLLYYQVTSVLSIYPTEKKNIYPQKDLNESMHSNFIHRIKNCKWPVSINMRMDTLIYSYKGIIRNNKKGIKH